MIVVNILSLYKEWFVLLTYLFLYQDTLHTFKIPYRLYNVMTYDKADITINTNF